MGPMRTARIVAGWAEQKAVREIMIFLHAHGVGTARAAWCSCSVLRAVRG